MLDSVYHSRAVAAHLKVVRRRKQSSAEGMRGGESTRRGLFPLSLGGFGGPLPPPPPPRFNGRFNVDFMRLTPDFSAFGHKDISCRVRNRMPDKIVFRQSHVVFFTFFSSACFFDIISSMSPQVLAK